MLQKNPKGISTTVFQEDIQPCWQNLSFWFGRLFKWVLAFMRWCVFRQEVHSMSLQHDLLKAVSKTPTYLLSQLGMLTRWRMNGDESSCGSSHCAVWAKERLCAKGRIIKILIGFNFPNLKNRHQVWKVVGPLRNTIEDTHQLSIY